MEEGNRTDMEYGLHNAFRSTARHGVGAEGVDGGLNDQIGKRKKELWIAAGIPIFSISFIKELSMPIFFQ